MKIRSRPGRRRRDLVVPAHRQEEAVAALQPRMTGEYVPVRLTIGRLELPSPKGIESDFSLEFGQQLSEKLQATRNGGTWSVGAPAMASPKREVVQIM